MSHLLTSKVQIVLRTKGWILESISTQWYNAFSKLAKTEFVIGNPQKGADIYFHFFYGDCKIVKGSINIVYVTHLSSYINSFAILKQYQDGCYFLTMSEETRLYVQTICNDYDCVISHIPESLHFKREHSKNKIKFGYFNKCHKDGRKNNSTLVEISKIIENSNYASLLIYGQGWQNEISSSDKILIDEATFNKEDYRNHMSTCDYVIYLSFDEGAISILDASTLSIPVLATNVGFHKQLAFSKGSMLFENEKQIVSVISNLVKTNEIEIDGALCITETVNSILKLKATRRRIIKISNIIGVFKVKYVYPLTWNLLFCVKYAFNVLRKKIV